MLLSAHAGVSLTSFKRPALIPEIRLAHVLGDQQRPPPSFPLPPGVCKGAGEAGAPAMDGPRGVCGLAPSGDGAPLPIPGMDWRSAGRHRLRLSEQNGGGTKQRVAAAAYMS